MMRAIRFGSKDKSGVHILFCGALHNKLCIPKKVEWDYHDFVRVDNLFNMWFNGAISIDAFTQGGLKWHDTGLV